MRKTSKSVCVTFSKSITAHQNFLAKLEKNSELNSSLGFLPDQSVGQKLIFLAMEHYNLLEVNFKRKSAEQNWVKEKVQPVKTETEIKTNEVEL